MKNLKTAIMRASIPDQQKKKVSVPCMAHSAVSGVSSKPDWLLEVANWTELRKNWSKLK